MKFWLSLTAGLMLATSASAADYRVVYSPTLELEVYIDNIASSEPSDWCKDALPLRIVADDNRNSDVLNSFLPRVGKLLQNQCTRLTTIDWQLTNKQGQVMATGIAGRDNGWQPVVTADSTASATNSNASPLDLSRPADTTPLPRFDLPNGCHFRTWWDTHDQALFIPDDKALRCNNEGWLEGHTQLTLSRNGQPGSLNVQFLQGYPLTQILLPESVKLTVLSANNQRMVLSNKAAEDSWLLLPFNPDQHVWTFKGVLLLKLDKQQAADPNTLKQRITTLRQQWSDVIPAGSHLSVMLVNDIHPDLADPAIGAWRTIDD